MDFSIRWFALWIFVKFSKSFFSRMMYRSKAMKKMMRVNQTKNLSGDHISPSRLVGTAVMAMSSGMAAM